MKNFITFTFLTFFLLSCRSSVKCIQQGELSSKTEDKRCLKIMDEASKKGIDTKVCYKPLKKEALIASEVKDPDPEKCKAIHSEARKKCDALPFDPKYIDVLSGSATYDKDGKLISIDGMPICYDSDK